MLRSIVLGDGDRTGRRDRMKQSGYNDKKWYRKYWSCVVGADRSGGYTIDTDNTEVRLSPNPTPR
jgi:hypothetical protein